MPADWALVLLRAAAPVAAKLTVSGLRKVTLSWRVSYTLRKRAKDNKLPVPPFWPLRRYLSTGKALSAFRGAERELYESLRQDLTTLTAASAGWQLTAGESQALVGQLLAAYTHALSVSEAVEVQVRNAITEMQVAVMQANSVQREIENSFDANLKLLAPVRAMRAKEISAGSSSIVRFVHELVEAQDRRQAIVDWQQNRPPWIADSSPATLSLMAEIAMDYGASESAAELMDESVKAGATPADYWRLRSALIRDGDDAMRQRATADVYRDRHPLGAALAKFLSGDSASALLALNAWMPLDIGETAFQTVVRVQFAAATGDIDAAIELAIEALDNRGQTGPALLAARYLLERGSGRQSPLHFADLERCLALAIRIRDTQRTWCVPSYEAVGIASDAAGLLGNYCLALELMRTAPEGQAIGGEVASMAVVRKAARLSAHAGNQAYAETLLSQLSEDDVALHETRALLAQQSGDTELERQCWLRAYHLVVVEQDRLNIAFSLALLGALPEAFSAASIGEGSRDFQLVNSAALGVPGSVETLTAVARSNRSLSFALIELLQRDGRLGEAARVSEQAGRRWSDPGSWILAARLYFHLGDYGRVEEAAKGALQVATETWGAHYEARILLFQSLAAKGTWTEAAEVAAQLLAMDPSSEEGIWALITCQCQLGDFEAALQTYASVGRHSAPRNEYDALLRVELWRREETASLDVLTDLLETWNESESVRAAVVNAILFRKEIEMDPESVSRVQALVSDLIENLPSVFVMKTIDPDDPLSTLQAMVDGLPDTTEIDKQVADGILPLGVASTVHNRSYAEVIATKSGPVFATDPATFDGEVTLAQESRGGRVVVDVTALRTLTLLHEAADPLLGLVGVGAVATNWQLRDSIRAMDDLSRRATMTVGRSPEGTPWVHEISEAMAELRFEQARTLREAFGKLVVVDDAGISQFSEVAGRPERFVWLSALDLALKQTGTYLWCDDARVRDLARSKGVPSFCTQALIETARALGVMTGELADAVQEMLIVQGYVGAAFDLNRAMRAAALDSWQPRGVAAFVMHGGNSGDSRERIDVVLEAMSQCRGEPESIRDWAAAAAFWLIRIVDDAAAARSNLTVFLSMVIAQDWLGPAEMPFVLSGLRGGIARSGHEIDDPLEPALVEQFRKLSAATDYTLAAGHIKALVHMSGTEDQRTAARVIVTAT
ncbi:tetratricopeptide repeat protein [Rhodococcus oryzae]|uniref:tetratricopeptide repeat protein n=1 Tax=Rhodococcus oryzae TaxID=2571143 RepID=UPI003722CF41